MYDRDESCARAEVLPEALHVEPPVVAYPRDADSRSGLGSHHLPRHDVGVVLHLGQQDLVSCLEIGSPPACGDQVDALGAAANEDDLLVALGVEELSDSPPRLLEGRRRALAQRVHAAVHVAVVLGIVAGNAFDHSTRFVGRRRVIQIHEWSAVHVLVERRELPPDLLDVEHVGVSAGRRRAAFTGPRRMCRGRHRVLAPIVSRARRVDSR